MSHYESGLTTNLAGLGKLQQEEAHTILQEHLWDNVLVKMIVHGSGMPMGVV
jgi:hypothetical protein